jgi:hypothetical protein
VGNYLTEMYDMARMETSTLKELMSHAFDCGFVLVATDSTDLSKAQEFLFDRAARVANLPELRPGALRRL